jgi:hypothetical protein
MDGTVVFSQTDMLRCFQDWDEHRRYQYEEKGQGHNLQRCLQPCNSKRIRRLLGPPGVIFLLTFF